jgi:electron transfer flavoprotein alpha subunit
MSKNYSADPFIELKQDIQAVEEEFTTLDPTDPPDAIRLKCREFAIKHLETSLKTIAQLVTSAEKETTQLAAAKVVIQIAQATGPKDDADPIKQLLEQIAN